MSFRGDEYRHVGKTVYYPPSGIEAEDSNGVKLGYNQPKFCGWTRYSETINDAKVIKRGNGDLDPHCAYEIGTFSKSIADHS